MTPTFDLLFRELASLITCVLLGCITLAFCAQVRSAIVRRDRAFFATPLGLGMTAMMLKNAGEWVDVSWVWLIQYSRVVGFQSRFDPATFLYAGYVGLGLLIGGSFLLIHVLSPVRWAARGCLAVLALTVVVALATHLPFANRIATRLSQPQATTQK